MEKYTLTHSEEENIKDLYLEKNLSSKAIAKKLNFATDGIINRFLQQNGYYKYLDGSKSKQQSILHKINLDNELLKNELKENVLICKITGNILHDILNNGGHVLKHMRRIHPDIVTREDIDSNYKKRQFEYKTGKKWYEDFFEVKTITIKPYFKCKYCNRESTDLDNDSGMYETHLLKKHNKTLDDYIKEFPSEIDYFPVYKTQKEKEKYLNVPENSIACKICGKKMQKITHTHVFKMHGMSLADYRSNYIHTLSKTSYKKFYNIYDKSLKLYERKFSSKAEKEISDFLNELDVFHETNNKKFLNGVELDIIVPGHAISIEYNGILYHREGYGKDKHYHAGKTNLCNNKNYRLIHIFEDEWINKKEIVKSKLKHIFKKNTNIIHARKCIISIPNNNIEKQVFLDSNHIQGNVNASISYAAYLNNEIVAIMCFDSTRTMTTHKNTEGEFELIRYATKSNHIITGMANKLLKHFIKIHNPKKIISFADKCWTNGPCNDLYIKLGFSLHSELAPDFKYINTKTHNAIRLHKFAFGKKALKKKFPEIYSDSKSEWEIMQEAGYDRIWDCGKLKYEMILSS